MLTLITYDISDNKRRRKVEKLLSSYGYRVNYSVFELEIAPGKFQKIIRSLKKVSENADHIRIYILNKEVLKKSFVLHKDDGIFEHEELYI